MGDVVVMAVIGVSASEEVVVDVRESPSSARRRPLSGSPAAPHRPGVSVARGALGGWVARAASTPRTGTLD